MKHSATVKSAVPSASAPHRIAARDEYPATSARNRPYDGRINGGSEQRLGVVQILDSVDVVPGRVANVERTHQPTRSENPDPAAQRRIAVGT
jgi:hypothetical protein